MYKINICGLNTDTLPRLSQSESEELMKKLKMGDMTAKEKFVMANIRLVLSVVQRFNKRENGEDMFQVGMVGLMKAIDGFDAKYNVRFSTYAVPMIMGEIRKYVKESSGIKVARRMRDVAYKYLKTKENIEKVEQREVSLLEVASEIDIPIQEIQIALDAVSDTISLQDKVCGDKDDSLTVMDQIGDDSQSEDIWTDKISIKQGLMALSNKERRVMIMRYFVGKTQVEISNKIGISQAQVSRLEKNALTKMKAYF